MAAKLTIRDIARLAGVSKSTVSRVLNQSSSVDPATREHVLSIMHQHGFIPSLTASGMRGRSKLIGMLVPSLTWQLMLELIMGIASVMESSAHELILYCCTSSKEYRDIVDRILATRLTAGLLAVIHDMSPEHLVELHEQGLPVVLINTTGLRVNLPLVVTDNYGGAYKAVQHLINLGHTRIGYIHGPADFPCAQDRYRGYLDALRDAGLSADPALFHQGSFLIEGGRSGAEAFFALAEPPTAIFTSNDETASGVLEVAREQGIRIPEDLAIVGFDDYPPAARMRPPLTTVSQSFLETGQCAAELLLSMLDTQYVFPDKWRRYSTSYLPAGSDYLEEEEAAPLQIQLPADLVIRESCGASQRLYTGGSR